MNTAKRLTEANVMKRSQTRPAVLVERSLASYGRLLFDDAERIDRIVESLGERPIKVFDSHVEKGRFLYDLLTGKSGQRILGLGSTGNIYAGIEKVLHHERLQLYHGKSAAILKSFPEQDLIFDVFGDFFREEDRLGLFAAYHNALAKDGLCLIQYRLGGLQIRDTVVHAGLERSLDTFLVEEFGAERINDGCALLYRKTAAVRPDLQYERRVKFVPLVSGDTSVRALKFPVTTYLLS